MLVMPRDRFPSFLAVVVLVASCARAAPTEPELPVAAATSIRSTPHAPADVATARLLRGGGTLVAAGVGDSLPVHVQPGTERPYMKLDTWNPWGQRLRFLVLRHARDDEGDVWLRIQLPIWPNGQAGWVEATDVRLTRTTERVVVDLSQRRLVRLRLGDRVTGLPVAIGSGATPTPPGRYVVWAKIDTDRPSGPYGSYILGLSGFSETIEPWSQWPGEPRLAIHGTDDPIHAGRAVSNGCVRVANGLLRYLRGVPMGTPVLIQP
jgi:lipoprotein-anchoring transpeptidase ErfK/SrfK